MFSQATDSLAKEELRMRFIVERDHASKLVRRLTKKQVEEINNLFYH